MPSRPFLCPVSFNPRTHTGCDQFWVVPRIVVMLFQSTHPHGVRHIYDDAIHITTQFQSTHPHGVRHPYLLFPPCRCSVSIHAPTRGATRLHQGQTLTAYVTIHAPTRGATSTKRKVDVLESVSIHAPTRGATSNMIDCAESFVFQSTHPHGVRRHLVSNPAGSTGVSIHAPTRGATSRCNCHFMPTKFQSTHPHGVRQGFGCKTHPAYSFNPRTHTGCDIYEQWLSKIKVCFNPRTHTGCDTIARLCAEII